LEAKESLEATYRQLKRDKTQDVWMVSIIQLVIFALKIINYIAGQDREFRERTEIHEGQAVGGNKYQVAEVAEVAE
jgi:hypothetical protein